jgi:hypothetical protein
MRFRPVGNEHKRSLPGSLSGDKGHAIYSRPSPVKRRYRNVAFGGAVTERGEVEAVGAAAMFGIAPVCQAGQSSRPRALDIPRVT